MPVTTQPDDRSISHDSNRYACSPVRPSLEEARQWAERYNLVPIWREVQADLDTPVSAYLKLGGKPGSFLLESVEGGVRLGRYSFVGADPFLTLSVKDGQATSSSPDHSRASESRTVADPLVAIQQELARYRSAPIANLPRFHGGAVGYLGYEAARYFERLPVPASNPLGLPDALFIFVDSLLVFDHVKHRVLAVSHMRLQNDSTAAEIDRAYSQAVDRVDALVEALGRPLPASAPNGGSLATSGSVESNLTPSCFEAMVERAKRHIYEGDIIQVVLSQRLSRPTSADPFTIYRALRGVNPSPYMYFLKHEDHSIVGASPEMLVRVEDGVATTHPIAGTRKRGSTPEEDERLEAELLSDEKERAEHVMLLDLGRNDIGRISVPGSVQASQVMEVERYSHVMHLVSHVTGRLRSDLTALDALRACFPAGTVSGAPKIRAMEIIAALEPDRRGLYAGSVGYIDFSGNLDQAIAIRTMVVKDGVAHIQAGGGIVADSVPELEYQESLNKAAATLQALDLAEGGFGR